MEIFDSLLRHSITLYVNTLYVKYLTLYVEIELYTIYVKYLTLYVEIDW